MSAQQPNIANNQEEKKVYIVTLKGEIFESLEREILKKFQRIDIAQAKAVILEIDTPGGLVTSALEICRQIDAIRKSKVPVYAYITGFAWSGGALIALACERIYMIKQASIGSAQVKILTPNGMENADEKSMSAMRAHFRGHANQQGYNAALAEAMVDPNIEVHEVLDRGMPVFVTAEELYNMRQKANEPGQVIDKGIIVPAGKLANFTAEEAKTYRFCTTICPTRESLLKELEYTKYSIIELKSTSEDKVVGFLSDPWVRMFFFAIGILGIFIELWTPGLGLPGIIGVASLAMAFVGGWLNDTAAVWEIILFIVGLTLLAIEIFAIPGFGVVGISGILCCVAAVLLSFQTFVIPETEAQVDELMQNVFKLTVSFGFDILAIMIIIRFLPEGAPLRRLSVATVQKVEDGYSVAIPSYQNLVGKNGVVVVPLRPAGRVQIEGNFYDVISQGDFLENGTAVSVVEVQGNRITVSAV